MRNFAGWLRALGGATVVGFSVGVLCVGLMVCDAAAKVAGTIGLLGAVSMLVGGAVTK